MKIDFFLKKHLSGISRYKNEYFEIQFSKSGVIQSNRIYFNNNRLLTDEINISYNPSIYLRSVEKCKTLEDVLKFYYEYSYLPDYVRILKHEDTTDKELKKILDFTLNFNKINGTVYFGEFEIIIMNNIVSFMLFPRYDFGTYVFTGKFDLLKIVNNVIGRLGSNIDFLSAIKKLEKI